MHHHDCRQVAHRRAERKWVMSIVGESKAWVRAALEVFGTSFEVGSSAPEAWRTHHQGQMKKDDQGERQFLEAFSVFGARSPGLARA